MGLLVVVFGFVFGLCLVCFGSNRVRLGCSRGAPPPWLVVVMGCGYFCFVVVI